MADDLYTTGFDEVIKNLRLVGEGITKKAIVAATRASAAVLKDAAKANAVAHGFVKSGKLVRGIRHFPRRSGVEPGTTVFSVGVKKPGGSSAAAGKARKDYPFYWKFLEFGYNKPVGSRANGGRSVKAIPAKPFIRPVLESHSDKALEAFRVRLDKYLANYKQPVIDSTTDAAE